MATTLVTATAVQGSNLVRTLNRTLSNRTLSSVQGSEFWGEPDQSSVRGSPKRGKEPNRTELRHPYDSLTSFRMCFGIVAETASIGTLLGTSALRCPSWPHALRNSLPHCEMQWASSIAKMRFLGKSWLVRIGRRWFGERASSGEVMRTLYCRLTIS